MELNPATEKEEIMSPILQLQKLVPATGRGEASLVFASTYSSICPTNSPAEDGQFEME
jgi:hypothetical protein